MLVSERVDVACESLWASWLWEIEGEVWDGPFDGRDADTPLLEGPDRGWPQGRREGPATFAGLGKGDRDTHERPNTGPPSDPGRVSGNNLPFCVFYRADLHQTMYDQVRQDLLKRVPFTEQELDRLCAALKPLKVKRKGAVQKEGQVVEQAYFVTKGLVRMFITEGGEERTFEICPEGSWVVDLGAFRSKHASHVNIEAIEESELLGIEQGELWRLYDEMPHLERFSRLMIGEKFIAALERFQRISHSDLSAEQRYLAYAEAYPQVVGRVPSVHLASYLGIASETLSRIRRMLLNNKRARSGERP